MANNGATDKRDVTPNEALILLLDFMTQGQYPSISERAYLGSGIIFGIMIMKRYPQWARRLEDADYAKAYKEADVKSELDVITGKLNIVQEKG